MYNENAPPVNRACPCGSGRERRPLSDARGIFCCYVCEICEDKQIAKYRPEIFESSNYESDEPIEADDGFDRDEGLDIYDY